VLSKPSDVYGTLEFLEKTKKAIPTLPVPKNGLEPDLSTFFFFFIEFPLSQDSKDIIHLWSARFLNYSYIQCNNCSMFIIYSVYSVFSVFWAHNLLLLLLFVICQGTGGSEGNTIILLK
jgi:hypothetical protein